MKSTHYFKDLFFTHRFFVAGGALAIVFLFSFFLPALFIIAKACLWLFIALLCIDWLLLFVLPGKIIAERIAENKMSLSDENIIHISITNTHKIPLSITVLDELPYQFQERNFKLQAKIKPDTTNEMQYSLRPTTRGEYEFGNIHVYVSSTILFIQKRYTSIQEKTIKVYPSYVQLKKYQLHALPEKYVTTTGRLLINKGSSTEFDAIKEYNRGDDMRTINWKASARRNHLMVNAYMDEKSQTVYCIIDKGRLMKFPFDNITLLDYAINAALMFSYVALQKDDKVGLLTFAEKVDDVLLPSKSKKQFHSLLETLYKSTTAYHESNYASLYHFLNKKALHRSLLLLFTNFETYIGFERQLPYIKAIQQKHVLVLVFFENTALRNIHEIRGEKIEDIYVKTIAEKFTYEKKMILKELQKIGVMGVFTTPANLTVDVVNKYLELKRRQFV